METVRSPFIDWGAAALALPGQTESGDRYVVKPFPSGVLVAAVDGLGHGEEAALAATTAVATLETYTASASFIELLKRCHEDLRGMRGVVLSLAWFNVPEGTMTWLGVGNVEGRLLRAGSGSSPQYEYLLLRGGVVGGQLPLLSVSIVSVMPDDTIVFATDGINIPFIQEINSSDPPQQIADRIIARHSKSTDDALVLVIRYLGGVP